jgi:hypothetical protein
LSKHRFAICTDNRGYEVSLEIRKLYEVLPDADAEKHAQIRVIDGKYKGSRLDTALPIMNPNPSP